MSDTTTSAPPTRPHTRSMSPDLPSRPVLADRQCEPRLDNPKDASAPLRPKGQSKPSRAGTFSNSRLPRSSSAQPGLPRGRSFQGVRPLSPAAQAAQDGYYQRKAAKMYIERRKAAAVARAEKDTKEHNDAELKDPSVPAVINITVDENGVMIDGAKGSQLGQALGGRRGSRSKMTRSSSRQRTSKRLEDKENASLEHDVDDYLRRKRGDHPRRKRDVFSDEAASWDGSMPRRQNSRSFIEQTSRSGALSNQSREKKAPTSNPADTASTANEAKGEKSGDEQGQLARTDRSQSSAPKSTANEEGAVVAFHDGANTADDGNILAPSNMAESAEDNVEPSSPTGDTSSLKPQEDRDSKQNVSTRSSVASLAVTGKAQFAEGKMDLEYTTGSSKMALLSSGKWCENCSGVGLHIAALLTELDKQRTIPETSCEPPSHNLQKKGWKTMVSQTVLGDSKGKNSSEKARLQQEISVLRATVDYLYKKVEAMEKGEGENVVSMTAA